jgi:hypothetical protein
MDHRKELENTTPIIFGHIEGLLEAWLSNEFGATDWGKELTITQRHRLIQLFRLLEPGWIVERMAYPYDTATKSTLIRLAQLVNTGSLAGITDEPEQEVISHD